MHDFHIGVEGLSAFLDNVTFPVLCANIDVANETLLVGKIKKSVTLTRSGEPIGIVGFVDEDTRNVSDVCKCCSN